MGVSVLGLSSRLGGSDPIKFTFYVLEEVKEGWEEKVVPSVAQFQVSLFGTLLFQCLLRKIHQLGCVCR